MQELPTSPPGTANQRPSEPALSPNALQLLSIPPLAPLREILEHSSRPLHSLPVAELKPHLATLVRLGHTLQSEVVSTPDDCPPGAKRDMEAWRRDWSGFCELRALVEPLVHSKGVSDEAPGITREDASPAERIKMLVHAGVRDGSPAILAMVQLHLPSEYEAFLRSNDPRVREVAVTDWRPPLTSDANCLMWLECVELERQKPGAGVARWQRGLPEDPPHGASHDASGGRSAYRRVLQWIGSVLHAMKEDFFQFPAFWKGEFSFIKPIEKRKKRG